VLLIEKRSPSFEVQDPLKEVNLGTSDKLRTTKVSGLLAKKRQKMAYQANHFAWDYHEMQ